MVSTRAQSAAQHLSSSDDTAHGLFASSGNAAYDPFASSDDATDNDAARNDAVHDPDTQTTSSNPESIPNSSSSSGDETDTSRRVTLQEVLAAEACVEQKEQAALRRRLRQVHARIKAAVAKQARPSKRRRLDTKHEDNPAPTSRAPSSRAQPVTTGPGTAQPVPSTSQVALTGNPNLPTIVINMPYIKKYTGDPPPKYKSQDQQELRSFLASCFRIFNSAPAQFPEDTDRVTYACSYLEGDIRQDWDNYSMSTYGMTNTHLATWDEFQTFLQDQHCRKAEGRERVVEALKNEPPSVFQDEESDFPSLHCTNCGKDGHVFRKCPEIVCHACKEKGHIPRDCPARP